jgi:uncharacterized RDD family membrane protein YckC
MMSPDSPASDSRPEGPPVSELPTRAVASFWPRIFAFLIDIVITAVPCAFVGFTSYRFFAESKLAGDLLGFFITLPYFAILGSSLGGGQTLGQRILHIRVADRDGRRLSLERSFLRYLILLTPFQLSEAEIPTSAPAALKILVSWLLPMLGAVIVYLYLFNVRTRQSLHDLAVGAYVVHADTKGRIETNRFWKWHWAVLGGGLFAVAVLASVMVGGLGKGSLFGELMSAQRAVLDSGKVQAARVQIGKNRTKGQTTTRMTVYVNWKGQPGNYDLASTEIAAIVLRADPDASKLDYLGVGFAEGFKIGFMNFSQNRVVMRRPGDWATKIQQLRFD